MCPWPISEEQSSDQLGVGMSTGYDGCCFLNEVSAGCGEWVVNSSATRSICENNTVMFFFILVESSFLFLVRLLCWFCGLRACTLLCIMKTHSRKGSWGVSCLHLYWSALVVCSRACRQCGFVFFMLTLKPVHLLLSTLKRKKRKPDWLFAHNHSLGVKNKTCI